ncbi:MAG: 2-dehydro-3-deoxy-phosphogluconate aldolase [Candidatus Roseilinea sp.]|nr:MAG: 2-dehydro-3-deoxy-phosphogluconate aldolase [Candidatus Roseilinea sp.]
MIEAGRVIAILRGDYTGYFRQIARTLADAGITAMEVTLNSPGALDGLHEMKAELGDRFLLGAGTVLNESQVFEAIGAGAQFIVAPNTNPRVVAICVERDICVIPGAYTPTEIMNAVELGAHLIKLFPAELGYFKAVRAPLSHVPFVATGGVSLDNAAEYIQAGAVAVGMGSQLIGDYVKQPGGIEALSQRAHRLMQTLALGPQGIRAI